MNTTREQRYTEATDALIDSGLVEESELPSLQDLVQTIKDTVDGEALNFPDFESFFAWWDVTTAYDQMDSECSAEHHKPALAVAYEVLVEEGVF